MSDPRDLESLLDMLIAARLVSKFAAERTVEDLRANDEFRSAVLYQLVVLGEAVKRVSRHYREEHPDIAWRSPAGLRDRVVHGYNRIDLDEIWRIVRDNLPPLISALEKLVPPEEA